MPHPKKKQSSNRTNMRRSAWSGKLKAPKLVDCPKCSTPKMPHVVCHVCGTYKGKDVLQVKHKVTRAERRAALKAEAEKEKKATGQDTGSITK